MKVPELDRNGIMEKTFDIGIGIPKEHYKSGLYSEIIKFSM